MEYVRILAKDLRRDQPGAGHERHVETEARERLTLYDLSTPAPLARSSSPKIASVSDLVSGRKLIAVQDVSARYSTHAPMPTSSLR